MKKLLEQIVSKEASVFCRETIDRIYEGDTYHCCSTSEFEIWHVGDCCAYERGRRLKEADPQLIFCGDLWSSPSLMKHHMRTNRFVERLRNRGSACCVMEVRNAHMVWGHDKDIFSIQIPAHLRDEMVRAAAANRMYSKSPLLGIYINDAMIA